MRWSKYFQCTDIVDIQNLLGTFVLIAIALCSCIIDEYVHLVVRFLNVFRQRFNLLVLGNIKLAEFDMRCMVLGCAEFDGIASTRGGV